MIAFNLSIMARCLLRLTFWSEVYHYQAPWSPLRSDCSSISGSGLLVGKRFIFSVADTFAGGFPHGVLETE